PTLIWGHSGFFAQYHQAGRKNPECPHFHSVLRQFCDAGRIPVKFVLDSYRYVFVLFLYPVEKAGGCAAFSNTCRKN
ncbi:MAG: hypothetical protein WBO06_11110, partial [Gammaproteobacteria bacterium]